MRDQTVRANLVLALKNATDLDDFHRYGEGYASLRDEVRSAIEMLTPTDKSIPKSYRGEGNNDIG
jgi:hypothetical protein